MSQRHIHAHAGKQRDHALWHRERLAVARRICPGHGDLLAPELINSAEVVDQMLQVGHRLGGVVQVALQVDQGRALFENAVRKTLRDGVGHRFHVGVAFADVHVVANPDDIGHKGDHVRSLPDRLAMRDLRLALVQVLNSQSQQVAGAGEAETGPRRVVAEDGDGQAAVEDPW